MQRTMLAAVRAIKNDWSYLDIRC